MGALAEAISKAANGGNPDKLVAACRSLPKRPGSVDPQSDDDPGPIPGESFDDVTAAWMADRLSDDVYEAALAAASGGSGGAREGTVPPVDRRALVQSLTDRLRSAGHDPTVLLAGASQSRIDAMAAGQVARESLLRTVPFEMVREEAGEAGGPDGFDIEGYGAVFDSDTEINSWEGRFIEKIRRGAFRKSLRETTPKMQFDHGHHPLLGGLPLGRWHIAEEDTRGLHLKGRLYDNWLVEPFRMAMTGPDQSVDGMSFRFSVVKEEWRDVKGKKITDEHELFELLYYGSNDRGPITRELIEVKAPEAGPVVWPAYKDTTVGARAEDNGTVVIDLGALRTTTNPADAFAARRRLAEVVSRVDAAVQAALVHTASVATVPPTGGPAATVEPHATGTPAGGHSERQTPEPPATEDAAAGGHSDQSTRPVSPQRPVAPAAIREDVRRDYRSILERTLALPPS